MSLRYLVVGAGYFGCSIAYHLARTGASTLLIDQGEIASGASGANFGCVQVQDANMGQSLEMTLEGHRLMQRVNAELGRDIGYGDVGSLVVAENEMQLEELLKRYEEKKEAGLDIRLLNAKELAEIEPNLAADKLLAATWYLQGRIWPFSYLFGLVSRGREAGLLVRENARVKELYVEGGTCRGAVPETGDVIRAEQVILCAGSGARGLCLGVGLDIPVYTVKAECFVSEALAPFVRNYYSSAGFFAEAHDPGAAAASLCIAQSGHGNLLIAETTKPDFLYEERYADATSPEHCRKVSALALEYFPALRDVSIQRSWVTQSPYTPGGLPVFGPSGVPGLFLAAGFKSCAVMSKLVGELTRDYMERGSCRYDLTEFTAQIKPISA